MPTRRQVKKALVGYVADLYAKGIPAEVQAFKLRLTGARVTFVAFEGRPPPDGSLAVEGTMTADLPWDSLRRFLN